MAARPRERELTATQRKELLGLLNEKRDELRSALKNRRNSGATAEDGRSGDEADQASEDAEVALETRLMDRDAKLLREVDRAFAKVDDDTYGLCEGTDEPIGYARLKLRPWTRYSVTYKEELEREEKRKAGG
ncbi:MAG: TraR/DksA family transcriptional regulator [Deltaproteobacteria bacterium]|nr:TraR/DksA family transcriptional regulator [Deltaproteobacteria bacterium]